MNKTAVAVTVIILAVLAVGAALYLKNQVQPTNPDVAQTTTITPTVTETPAVTTTVIPAAVIAKVEVKFTDNGYEPKTLTVKKGTTVTFVNKSTKTMWVASAPHPTHTDYPEFDQGQNADTYEFTFDKVGSWKFHNHSPFQAGGVVNVTE